MLFRSISILLLLSLTAFGQAFTPRRPFILQSAAAGPFNPSNTFITGWWVYTDLPTNNIAVTNWPDRMGVYPTWNADTLGAPSIRPTNMVDGVYFHSASGQTLTNEVGYDGTNSSFFLVLNKPENTAFHVALSGNGVGYDDELYWDPNQSTWLLNLSLTEILKFGNPGGESSFFDLTIVNLAGNASAAYTNGVLAITNNHNWYGAFDRLGTANLGFWPYEGKIKEFGLYSNATVTATTVSNLHNYWTNLYKYSP